MTNAQPHVVRLVVLGGFLTIADIKGVVSGLTEAPYQTRGAGARLPLARRPPRHRTIAGAPPPQRRRGVVSGLTGQEPPPSFRVVGFPVNRVIWDGDPVVR